MKVTASGEASSASEISALRPVITCTTPSGSLASANSLTSQFAIIGVCEAALSSTALPAMRAGPSLRAGVIRGSFHGQMASTTPTGSTRALVCVPGRASASSSPQGWRANDA